MLSAFSPCLLTHRILGLGTGETRAVSLGHRTIPSAMDRDSSFAKSHGEDAQKSEEKDEVR